MASIIKFGSLVMNGEVCPFPTLRDGKDFWLGDTAEKHQIHWLVVDNKLVCCWNLITRLSWEELEAGRWASGKPVFLDGFSFGCRLLQQSDDGSYEWDRAMEACGGDKRCVPLAKLPQVGPGRSDLTRAGQVLPAAEKRAWSRTSPLAGGRYWSP